MSDQYLTFTVDQQSYGIRISAIREINRIGEIMQVPEAPSHVAGVMNLRGKVVPVVSLRLRMKMEEIPSTKETCTIVVETSGGQVGVVVDSVKSVVSLEKNEIDESPLHQQGQNYIFGIGKTESGMIMLIDIESCLQDEFAKMSAAQVSEAEAA